MSRHRPDRKRLLHKARPVPESLPEPAPASSRRKKRKSAHKRSKNNVDPSSLETEGSHPRDLLPDEGPVSNPQLEEYELVEEWRKRTDVNAGRQSETPPPEPEEPPASPPPLPEPEEAPPPPADPHLTSILHLREAEIRQLKDVVFSLQLRVKQLEPIPVDQAETPGEIVSMDAEVADLFKDIIGMGKLKLAFQDFYSSAKLNVARRKLGIQSGANSGALGGLGSRPHMCFVGNPGTGKTKMARLVKTMMQKVDLLPPNGKFLEVSRDDLVGGFVGQTEARMKAAFEMARDGVLFVDEAYRLTPTSAGSHSSSDYGRIALDAILTQMTAATNSITFIFAGYPTNMTHFLTANPGLRSRIPYTFQFPDYSCPELAAIFERTCVLAGFDLAPDVDRTWLAEEFGRFSEERRRSANGRLVEVLFNKCRVALDARLSAWARKVGDGMTWERRLLQTIERGDVEEGMKRVEIEMS
ncbi:P-loop containing nucleoside triphosphate hydrolase protein [Gonapodya prolifera JEL478]|uniref:p-loop containing nucleoside triphosphate hydrolase protein n=1 Tax=Gonapodya prolifera (strain JEL478) TaxID=1344416 RepID=A0A139AQJ9_GONPJ|nr:P-loop containing nucleoside triphosphate hydrolase protein [Gonapodya prolifera JEL478]|eukprot:KXS19016.1 P-loop containing nucleoside triphosphate hydrolase protein [Gonapodya prolifera JEL478]